MNNDSALVHYSQFHCLQFGVDLQCKRYNLQKDGARSEWKQNLKSNTMYVLWTRSNPWFVKGFICERIQHFHCWIVGKSKTFFICCWLDNLLVVSFSFENAFLSNSMTINQQHQKEANCSLAQMKKQQQHAFERLGSLRRAMISRKAYIMVVIFATCRTTFIVNEPTWVSASTWFDT